MDTTLLPSRPERYSTLIRYSLKLYRASFARVILLSLLLSLIVFIPRFISYYLGYEVFENVPPIAPQRLWLLVINLICLVLYISILWRIFCVATHVNEPVIQDIRIGIQRILYVFAAILLQSLIISAIAMFFFGIQLLIKDTLLLSLHSASGIITASIIVLGQLFLLLYIATLFIFVVPLIAVENRTILSAIKTSVLLVCNHWWRVFSTQITPWIVFIISLIIIKIIFQINIHIYFFDTGPHPWWATAINLILFILLIPWVASLMLVQMKELEIRNHALLNKESLWKRRTKKSQRS